MKFPQMIAFILGIQMCSITKADAGLQATFTCSGANGEVIEGTFSPITSSDSNLWKSGCGNVFGILKVSGWKENNILPESQNWCGTIKSGFQESLVVKGSFLSDPTKWNSRRWQFYLDFTHPQSEYSKVVPVPVGNGQKTQAWIAWGWYDEKDEYHFYCKN